MINLYNKILHLFLFFFLMSFHLFGQNQIKIDSLKSFLETETSDKKRIDIWNDLAKEYSYSDSTLVYFYTEKVIKLSQKISYKNAIIEANINRSWILKGLGYIQEAKILLSKNLEKAQKYKYSKGEGSILNVLASIYKGEGDMEKALNLYQKSLKIRKKLNDQQNIAYTYINIAIVYDLKSDYEKALDYNFKAIKILEKLNDQQSVAQCYVNIGIIYNALSKYQKTLDYHFKALKIFKKIEDTFSMSYTYLDIASVYEMLSNYPMALKYNYKALKIGEDIEDNRTIASCYTNIGSLYIKLDNPKKASKFFFDALKINKKTNDTYNLVIVYLKIGKLYSILKKYQKASNYYSKALNLSEEMGAISLKLDTYTSIIRNYLILEKYLDAQKYLDDGLAICQNSPEDFVEDHIELLDLYGQLYYQKKEFREAQKYLNKALILAQSVPSLESIRDIAQVLSEVEKSLGNYKEAYKAQVLFKNASDSLLNETKSKQIAGLEIQYETEKKEQKIESLKQNNKIKDLQLHQASSNFIILSIVLVLISLLGIILYLFFRQKRLKLKQKAQAIEQKLLRVQMNPHFIFNALTAIQEYMFKAESQKAGLYLMKFSKLMRQILENSRNEYISLDKEINMLENYLSLQNLKQKIPFEYEIRVDNNINTEETAIPPMFAQPFVENAIEHGISQLEGKGKIDINFSLKNNQVILEVRDNGIGIQQSKVSQQNKKHQSLATQITKERIDIFRRSFKKNINFEVQNLQQGTAIIFRLPYQYV